jgi:hypothetical protein
VILYTHGNAEDIGPVTQDWMKFLSLSVNCSVISYDYTGYGLNQVKEKPTGRSCYKDIESVWDFLINEKGYSPDRIVLYVLHPSFHFLLPYTSHPDWVARLDRVPLYISLQNCFLELCAFNGNSTH